MYYLTQQQRLRYLGVVQLSVSGLGLHKRLQSSCWSGLWSSQASNGAGESWRIPGSLVQLAGRPPFLAGYWPESSVLHHVGLCIRLLIAWQPVSLRQSDLREGASEREPKMAGVVFGNLLLEVTYHHFIIYCQLYRPTLVNVGGGCTRLSVQGGSKWGPFRSWARESSFILKLAVSQENRRMKLNENILVHFQKECCMYRRTGHKL